MHDEARVYNTVARDFPTTRILGPNCPGILTVGRVQHRLHPRRGRASRVGRSAS